MFFNSYFQRANEFLSCGVLLFKFLLFFCEFDYWSLDSSVNNLTFFVFFSHLSILFLFGVFFVSSKTMTQQTTSSATSSHVTSTTVRTKRIIDESSLDFVPIESTVKKTDVKAMTDHQRGEK